MVIVNKITQKAADFSNVQRGGGGMTVYGKRGVLHNLCFNILYAIFRSTNFLLNFPKYFYNIINVFILMFLIIF